MKEHIQRTPRQSLQFILLAILYFFSISLTLSQTTPSVQVKGRATDRSIMLRWAPSTPALWHFANEYGYIIERITISVNNKVLEKPIHKILNDRPIRPQPLSNWEAMFEEDDYVAIAAQCIYGDQFELTNNFRTEIVQVMNKVQELESRYSFCLFAADQSRKAAQLSGLFFEDESIAPNTKYLYRIYSNATKIEADTGFVFLGLNDHLPLPKIRNVQASFTDKCALLSWDGKLFGDIYNSFWLERSEDGRSFRRTTELPIINTFSGDDPNTNRVFKSDSLPQNSQRYYYRVKGITCFGEEGPPSDTISGEARRSFNFAPSITNGFIDDSGQANIEWSFPEEGSSLVERFQLLSYDHVTRKYVDLNKIVDKSSRSIKNETNSGSVYYVVGAVDVHNRSTYSQPYLVQSEDSIPPLPPAGLTGRIDDAGIVSLAWQANAESDLFGYSVYRANFENDEFVQLPRAIDNRTHFVDTIKVDNLTEKIYYRVKAIDKRFNLSDFSAVVEIEKPDTVSPVPPVFAEIFTDSTGVNLRWNISTSSDVLEHQLFRRQADEDDWSLLKIFSDPDSSSFVDDAVTNRTKYYYTLIALDDDGLESIPAQPVCAVTFDFSARPPVEPPFFRLDKENKIIHLSWTYKPSDVIQYLLYKITADKKMMLYKTIDASTSSLSLPFRPSDTEIILCLVAEFQDGARSAMSEPAIIKF